MKNRLYLLVLIASLSISGCNTFKEYDEDSFPTFSWSDQIIEFKPSIEDISKSYRIGYGVRHIYGLRNSTINIRVQTIAPSGSSEIETFELTIKDDDGDYVGNCAGDFCDFEEFVLSEFKFEEAGEYTFKIILNEQNKVAGIMGLGLIIATE